MTATKPKPAALPGETEREYAWRLFPRDAKDLLDAHEAPSTNCRQPLCHAPVWWGVTAATGARTCFDIKPDGTRTRTNHWRTCRDRPGRQPTTSSSATTHRCPAADCGEQVPEERLACRTHWFALPKDLRDQIWRAYQGGQERTHWHLIQEAVAFLQAREVSA